MSESASSLFGGAPYERPETPGYHAALIGGGGPFGQRVSVCVKCGTLLSDIEEVRMAHTAWHEHLDASCSRCGLRIGNLDKHAEWHQQHSEAHEATL